VKHTGDGIFASFSRISSAVDWSLQIQRGFGEPLSGGQDSGRLRIGISAGEPVSQHEDLWAR
jgi:class 3 adenylate cyclase